MAQLTYLDFDLLVERWQDQYKARVINSPAGQAASVFRLPFSDTELSDILLRLGQSRHRVRHLSVPQDLSEAETSALEAAKAFGGRLYEAVFTEQMHGCLRASLDEAQRRGAGLRIRLRLTEAPELADWPWEYLYHSALNRFLSLSTQTPIVRYFDLPERIQPLAVQPPLKILVMISSPQDQPRLDVEREWEKLQEALRDLQRRKLVVLEKLEEATLPALQKLLRRTECHIFHFIGHGDFDQQRQDGVLIFEDAEEQGRPVSGQELGTLLHDHGPLRLAVLNACEGGWAARANPFAGAAPSLVQQGVPAVIAMQFPITDEAAIAFAQNFYGALADGYPVDAALSEARKAIFGQGNEVEWGTPVLFMRAAEGRIFDVASVGTEDGRLKGEDRRPKIEDREKEPAAALQQNVSGAGGQVIQAGRDVIITQPENKTEAKKSWIETTQAKLTLIATFLGIIVTIFALKNPLIKTAPSSRFQTKVVDQDSNIGISGVTVQLMEIDGRQADQTVKTSSDGSFVIKVAAEAGTKIRLSFEHPDYQFYDDYYETENPQIIYLTRRAK